MKKFALLSMSALMMLAVSCSDDNSETPRPPIPTDPVQTVPSVADQVPLNLPEQSTEYTLEGNLYVFKYSNGQQLTFQISEAESIGHYALLKRMVGENIVIPPTVVLANQDGVIDVPVIALNLFQDGNESVKHVTMSKTITQGFAKGVLADLDGEWLRWQISVLPNLESFEIETGNKLFCSIDGAIYSADMKNLVAVPRLKSNVFTIAEDTEVVEEHAFFYCTKITGITFPANVKEIRNEAVSKNDMLVLINMQPVVAPKTAENAFGKMAQTSRLNIPAGSRDSYFPAKPDLKKPVEPADPGDEATDEEYDAYLEAMAQYRKDIAEYNEVASIYNNAIGFRNFKDVVEVNF